MLKKRAIFFYLLLCLAQTGIAQTNGIKNEFNKAGWLSFGARSTLSTFGDEGSGIGTGGQFRIQMSKSINSDWYFDYISINVGNKVRSEYYHIGWSVLYYPFKNQQFPKIIQPYVLAGHCFDYNKMTAMDNSDNFKERWGLAVQGGLGVHFNITDRFDITLMSQYMIHFTESLHANTSIYPIVISSEKENALQGHLLSTISLNYLLIKIWGRKN